MRERKRDKTIMWLSFFQKSFFVFFVVFCLFSSLLQAHADVDLLVPTGVIYPGESITDSMIKKQSFLESSDTSSFISQPEQIIGKMARRTLLPGQPIALSVVDDPKIVKIGASVRLIYDHDGLVITTSGMSMQSASVGEIIKVRNVQSGLVVSGTVSADGSVRVGPL